MIVHRIQHILEQEKFECTTVLSSEGKGILYDQLIVYLGKDFLVRERIVEIICRPLQFKKHPHDNHYSIQFQVQLPFVVHNLSLTQVSSLLLFINHLTEWPCFELDELKNQVSFRYIWLTKESAIDSFLLLNIIGSIILSLDAFSETIEQVASGFSTFNEVLQKIVALGKSVVT